ncbi:MAG: WD40 repeat domain-containing protein, partial [Mastigocoleus sp. MO_167.B18]|nr:WD40 repeat domain-containing protein [Mastigocoleus sp. MO_167.B18]
TIKIWNLVTGELIRTLEGHKGKVSSVAISPDGQTFVSGSHDRTIKLWNLATGEEIRTFISSSNNSSKAHSQWVSCLAISPDGNILASGSGDRSIKLWSLVTGEEIDTLRGHSGYITSLSFSPAIDRENIPYQQTLSSGAMGDNTIKVWRMSQ